MEFLRRCYACGESKSLDRFVAYSKRASGRTHRCKLCASRAALEGKRLRRTDNVRKKDCARHAVLRAIKNGVLQRRSCEICGNERVEAHHDDYDLPLKVRWLCNTHHHDWHSKHGEGANASQQARSV
jgi:ribosomal protein S27AE